VVTTLAAPPGPTRSATAGPTSSSPLAHLVQPALVMLCYRMHSNWISSKSPRRATTRHAQTPSRLNLHASG
jgi:hypothetical protein